MAVVEPTEARLLAVQSWYHGLKTVDQPEWEDVEIVTRLRITREAAAREVILGDLPSLLRVWEGLQQAQSGGAVPTTVPTGAAAEPADRGGLAGLAARRYEALLAWFQAAPAAGIDLKGLTTDDLLRIAEAGPTTLRAFKQFPFGARSNDEALLAVLNNVDPGHAAENAAPAAGSPEVGPAVEDEVSSAPRPTAVSGSPAPPGSPRTGTTSVTGFAPFDWQAPATASKPTPLPITFSVTSEEMLRISWQEAGTDDRVRLYRVVTNDQYAPNHSPVLGDLLCATFDTEVVDERTFASPVRYAAVWLNEGATEDDARSAQPVLHAAGGCVLPVRHCEVRDDEGTVIGQWEPIDGVLRVDVLRLPIDQAAKQQHFNQQYRLRSDLVGPGGFSDSEAVPGVEYEYRVYAVASVSGQDEDLSPYVARRVKLQAVVEAVPDLKVALSAGSEDEYDLRWTMPPLGVVEIYRTEAPPTAGIDQVVLDRATLVRLGLTEDLRLTRPLNRDNDQGTMDRVPWPRKWSRAYFTPVTVVDEDQLKVGPSDILTRANAPTQIKLIQRVDEQFLTFAWPEGVTTVKIYQGPSGGELVGPESQLPLVELSREEYNKYGGAHLPHPLPGEGCAVHVVGSSYSRGRAILSRPVTVQYAGLARLSYDLVPLEQGGRFSRRTGSTLRKVTASSEFGIDNVPTVVVHHPRRLPLFAQDGQELCRRTISFPPGAPQVVADRIDLAGRSGFVRLFVDVPAHLEHKLAVLDPPVDRLRCR